MIKTVERITGMKKFKGEIDGRQFDTTTVFIDMKMDDRTGTRRGTSSIEFNAGTSAIYDRHNGVSLPAQFEVDWATLTNGSKSKQVIVGLEPIKPTASAKAGSAS